MVENEQLVPLPDAAHQAEVTYRQIDYWSRMGVLNIVRATQLGEPSDGGPGSRSFVVAWKIPRLRLMGRVTRQVGAPGVSAALLLALFEHYRDGVLMFDGFRIEWEVEEE